MPAAVRQTNGEGLGKWIAGRPRLGRAVSRVCSLHLGILLVLSIMPLLARLMPLIMVVFSGPAVGVILVANVLDVDDELPDFLHLPHLDSWRVLGFFGLILIVFLLALGAEVLIKGPDLRADGLHRILAPTVLGSRAIPMMLYDPDEKHEPLAALYLGGNADLYVLYDPCAEIVRLVSVGSLRVELIDRVDCRSP